MRLIGLIYRFILSLRYRIEVKGADLLVQKKVKILLPNHQASVDPQILFTELIKYSRVQSVVSEKYYNAPFFKQLFNWLGVIRVSDLEAGNRDHKVLDSVLTAVVGALKDNKNVLLYPAGQLVGQGYEKIFNKQSAWSIVNEIPDNIQIVGVRITGLWGSMWSRAWLGKSPNILWSLIKAVFYIFFNFIFFLPKRRVLVEFEDITEQSKLKALEGKKEFNTFLEVFYNKHGEENALFLKHFFFMPTSKRQLPNRVEGSVIDLKKFNVFSEDEIPEDVFSKVKEIINVHTVQKASNISLSSSLNFDLNIDSLELVMVITAIEEAFNRTAQVEVTSVKTVADLCFIAMNRKIDDEELKPSNLKNFTIPYYNIYVDPDSTVPELLVKAFKSHSQETFIYDKMLGSSTRKQFLMKAWVVSKIIKNEVHGDYVGIMLPALQSTALLIAATYLAGKVPVMLNWTVGPKVLDYCIKTVGLTKIITAQKFLDRVSDQVSSNAREKCIFFEQKVKTAKLITKLQGVKAYYFEKSPMPNPCDTAVILFTSGSETLPKAVPLSHTNLLADLHGAFRIVKIQSDKIFLSFLPPFHSFGFTVLTIFPLVTAVKIAYTPDPTDSREVLKLLLHTEANTVVGTPTFLKMLMSVASGNDLKNLQIVVSGAERMSSIIADTFIEKTGGRAKILEGYGITECAPALSINSLDLQKTDSVGLFLKGISHLIVDFNSFEPLPQGETGMIMVRGRNVFAGYIDKNIESPFVEINGKQYYKTGDLGYVDKDGYLFITGRLKRFLKIAGEMISLPAIENSLNQKYGHADEVVLAIEGNDELNPPQIVLFATIPFDLTEINQYLKQSGFSSLVKVHKIIQVEQVPLLGTGKTDYKVLKSMIV